MKEYQEVPVIRIILERMQRLFCACVALVAFQSSVRAQNASPVTENARGDSALVKRERMRSRATWEEIAYLPGRIIYSPLEYSLKGLSMGIGYVDDTKLIPKIRDFLTSDDGRRGVEPTYSARTGTGIQFYQKGLFRTGSDRNTLELTLTGGSCGRLRYQCTLEEILFADGRISSDLFFRYRKLPTESFFGIGPDSPRSDETEFAQKQTSAEVSLGTNIRSDLIAELLLGYDCTEIDFPSTATQYTGASLPGIEEQVDMICLRYALIKDSKNRPGNPTRGYEASLSGGWHQQLGDDRFGFVKYTAEAIKYLHLFYDRALVFRVAGEITEPFEDREIPFYYLSELGRRETIRGFSRGRFRDSDMLLASAEYRYPIWGARDEYGADFLLFADTGRVSSDLLGEMAMDDLQTGFGFGLRLWDQGGVIARFEAAKSVDGWRLYFVLN